jgi:ferredoxin-NADP reductase
VEGPIGAFVLPDRLAAPHLLFIAGGAGIAPLRAMLWQALAQRARRRVTVVYSARSPRHFAYLAELRRLARARRITLVLLATREARAGWRGRRGRLDAAFLRSLVRSSSTWCFLCGPPGLVAGAASELRRLGIPARRIRMERWKA